MLAIRPLFVLWILTSALACSPPEPDAMEIRKTYTLPFDLSAVYEAWVSSSTVIPPATAMDILPEVGGHYRLMMEGEDFAMRNEGRFLALTPNEHVRYTWEWNGDGEVTEIDVTFTAVDAGTRIDLLHTGFSKRESVDSHDAGWDSYIEGFSQYLSQ